LFKPAPRRIGPAARVWVRNATRSASASARVDPTPYGRRGFGDDGGGDTGPGATVAGGGDTSDKCSGRQQAGLGHDKVILRSAHRPCVRRNATAAARRVLPSHHTTPAW